MKTLSIVILLSSSLYSFGQTKKIAHRSHSGSNHTFSLKALDNLGVAPTVNIKVANLDTLKYLGDNKVLMVTSEVCWLHDHSAERSYDTTLWKAGADTLVDHAVFGQQHKLEWVKKVIKNNYNFENDVEDTEFIGYDNTEIVAPQSEHSDQNEPKSNGEHNGPMNSGSVQEKDSRVDHSMLWFLAVIPFLSLGFFARGNKE